MQDDIYVENFVINESMFKLLPLPSGEYNMRIAVSLQGIWVFRVEAFLKKTE